MHRLVIGLIALAVSATASAQVYVHGYTKKDGTYVAPHYRSTADGNPYDNWSTKGNVNPYTGQPGTKNPYGGSNGTYGYSNPYSSTTHQTNSSATTCYLPPC